MTFDSLSGCECTSGIIYSSAMLVTLEITTDGLEVCLSFYTLHSAVEAFTSSLYVCLALLCLIQFYVMAMLLVRAYVCKSQVVKGCYVIVCYFLIYI